MRTAADYKAEEDLQNQCASLANNDPVPHKELSQTWEALIRYTKDFGLDNDGMSSVDAPATEKFNVKKGAGGGCEIM